MILNNPDEILEQFDLQNLAEMAVLDARNNAYLLYPTEEGTLAYQGVPMPLDEDGHDIDANNGIVTPGCRNCVGVLILDGRPLTCSACGADVKHHGAPTSDFTFPARQLTTTEPTP
jgi:hypothetical protein